MFPAAIASAAQAMDAHGRPVWTAVYLVSHRDLAVETKFAVLSSGNGTTLTLTDTHIAYIADAAGSRRVPVATRNVQVRRCLRRDLVDGISASGRRRTDAQQTEMPHHSSRSKKVVETGRNMSNLLLQALLSLLFGPGPE
jgi:hypothetical protein